MKKEKLLEKLAEWERLVRRDEAPNNIIWHIDDDSAYQDIVALIKKEASEVDEDTVNRYKVLFHDAPPSRIEQLIRKLIKEVGRSK